jgi:iron complex outermembrane receptor protein
MTSTHPLAASWRMLVTCAASAVATSVIHAQSSSEAPKDDRVLMSNFEVTSTQGKGYTSSNAATGFKTNEELIKIPQAVTLVTRDLIDDIGAVDGSNILRFAGVSNFFAGESFALRGTRINYPLLDEMPNGVPYEDNVNLDSYTVLRGPAATLYLNAALGGTILTTSKIPMSKPMYSITTKVDSNGIYRVEGDFTGPLATAGDFKFTYRLTTALQEGEGYFKNVTDHRNVIHPTFQMAYKKTVVRVAFDYQHLVHVPNGNSLITPEGKLYTGAGRDEAYYAPGTMENFHRRGVRTVVIQKLADNWDVKVAATRWWFSRYGVVVFPTGGVNWPAQTIKFNSRKNDQKLDFSITQVDVNGKYHIGPISTQSTFGASYSHEEGKSHILGFPASVFPTATLSLSNPNLNSIIAPDVHSPVSGNPSGSNTYRGNAYFQQTIDIIPKWLTLVGGLTRSKIKINNITNLNTGAVGLPAQGQDTLHRVGAVVNITKDLVIYAMESTTFTPTSNRDVNLSFLPNAEGKGREAGIKTSFFDGRISSTLSFFKLELTNQSFFGGVRPDGISYYTPIGATTQKGFDMDLAYSPIPGLQFIGTYYNGKVNDQTGAKVANSYTGLFSLVGRYEMQGTLLKGLSFGAGLSRLTGRQLAVGAYVTGLAGVTLLEVKPSNELSLFASYKLNRNWLFRVNVDNALDEAYVLGAQNAYFVDPSTPRTLSGSVTYKF